MANRFGKIKRFINRPPARKSPSIETLGRVSPAPVDQAKQRCNEDKTSSSSSVRSAAIKSLKSGTDNDDAPTNPIEEIQNYEPITTSDDVLDGILKDWNIRNGRTAAKEKDLDTVSEFTGKSARSIVDEDSDDDDTESKNEETSDAFVAENASASKKGQNTKSENKNPKLGSQLDRKISSDEASFDTGEDFVDNNNPTGSTYDDGSTYDEDDTIYTNGTDDSGGANVSNEDKSLARGLPTTKKAVINMDVVATHPGEPSGLAVRAVYCAPQVGNPDDIVVKVEASTVSFQDCLLRMGFGMEKAPFPFVPGCEFVGTIVNLGSDAQVEGYRVGDRVVGMSRRGGGNGKYAKFSTLNVAPFSSTTMDAADVVCLVNVYMTAYQALRLGKKDGTPLTDANVLITDGFSPMGQAAAQLARLEGANVWVTTNDNSEDEYMTTLGAKCLRMNPSKWLRHVKGKMDVVIDNACIDSYESSWQALNSTGLLICTGITSIHNFKDDMDGMFGCNAMGDIMRDYKAKWTALKAKYMMSKTKFLDLWESFQKDRAQYRQEFKYLCYLVESGMLKPKIADRISLEKVPEAHRRIETGKVNGTIVCLL
ncbi:hypothetical protein ACHAW5_002959 [Stephanodiscus triporus]|uniref:Enoyl reductase (ER) domain-containing protein n=1 Tax=Stephanodiscus triporus TaxID=2934178 RepID=A0ABD3PFC0_9STRA